MPSSTVTVLVEAKRVLIRPTGANSAKRGLRRGQRCAGRLSAALLAGFALAAVAQTQRVHPDARGLGAAPKGGFVLDAEPHAPTPTTPAPPAPPAPPSPEVQDTLQRINGYRAAGATCGSRRFEPAAPLAWNALLEQAALKHARDMAARRTMSHTGGDGSSMSDRVAREAYAWGALGENVSAGYSSVPDALAGWMRSPGHCANIMSASFREVGVGAANAPGDSFGWYRAMVLGSPGR